MCTWKTGQRLMAVLLFGIALCMQVPAFAAEEETDIQIGDLVFSRFPRGYVVSSYEGNGGDVNVPARVEGEPVYAIDAEAFAYASFLTSVTLPDTIEAIGHDAFKNCMKLEEVQWSSRLWGIGVRAFTGCTALKELCLPDSVRYISESAFEGCLGLESVTLSPYLTDIGPDAFADCSSLRVVQITGTPASGSVLSNEFPFSGCMNLEQIFYGGSEADLRELIPAEQLAWATVFLVTPNLVKQSVRLDTYLGGPGDIALPVALGDYTIDSFGTDVFPPGVGHILYAGTSMQWDAIDPGNGNEEAFSSVLCLGSDAPIQSPELEWVDERVRGASFGNLNGMPLQAISIERALKEDEAYRYSFYGLDGEQLRSFDLLMTGARVKRASMYESDEATIVLGGDVLGNGTLNISQLVRMARAMTGTDALDGVFLESADLNHNGEVDIADLVTESSWLMQYA